MILYSSAMMEQGHHQEKIEYSASS